MELAVNITTYLPLRQHLGLCMPEDLIWVSVAYCYGSADCDDIAFFNQQLSSLVANLSNLGLGDGTARSQLRDGSFARTIGSASVQTITAWIRPSYVTLGGQGNSLVEIAHPRSLETGEDAASRKGLAVGLVRPIALSHHAQEYLEQWRLIVVWLVCRSIERVPQNLVGGVRGRLGWSVLGCRARPKK